MSKAHSGSWALPSTETKIDSGKRKVLISSVIGSIVEWYDYTLYGVAAALVFNHLFFPNFSSAAGTIAAFGSFAVGFIARPLGGWFAGQMGDRIGRKTTLVLTLMLMGVSTTLIGCLPTYEQIGMWAPALLVLMRVVQGFAVGGEWGGAVLMAVEHAPDNRRGMWGAFPQTGVSAGLVLGSAAFAAASALPEADFLSWGWRIPFLFSVLLAIVGLFIRLKTEESPAFLEVKKSVAERKSPAMDVFRNHRKSLLLALGARFAEGGNYYIYTVFILAFTAQYTSLAKSDILLVVMVAALFNIVSIPFWGAVSDRIGRRPVFIGGSLFIAISAYPFFLMAMSGSLINLGAALIAVLCLGHGPVYGTLAAYYAELFPTSVRYSGISIGYQAASIVLGGITPMLASALILWAGGSPWAVILMMVVSALIAAGTMLVSPETYRRDLKAI
ncbi:MFS transporter [Pseudomonas taiwanensis]|uniref:MHS family MFS transporter n=1 Tax=Pseudomonas taiwanensis TaxID=470150 RepID=A0ABR6VC92_9PSED|nr:MFS transporter [Pseudomonas taiwanensis]MBC3478014.1 MHS family MFS transporter [Pseudomonas taiwanensis]